MGRLSGFYWIVDATAPGRGPQVAEYCATSGTWFLVGDHIERVHDDMRFRVLSERLEPPAA